MNGYRASDEAIDAARSQRFGGVRWGKGERPKSGRELLREKIERAVNVELAAGRLLLPERP